MTTPRRGLLLLLLAAAACCLLAAPTTPAHEPPTAPHDLAPSATTVASTLPVSVYPATVDDGVFLGAERGGVVVVPPHLIHPNGPVDERTVYDVTVIFRATRRLGPPRLEYYVVPLPGGANVPRPSSNDDGYSLVTLFWVSFGIVCVGVVLLISCAVCCGPRADDDEEARSGGGGGAVPRKTGGSVGLAQAPGSVLSADAA